MAPPISCAPKSPSAGVPAAEAAFTPAVQTYIRCKIEYPFPPFSWRARNFSSLERQRY